MYEMTNMSIDELCPYIRKVGKQEKTSWRKRFRRIYDHEILYCIRGKANILIEERHYFIKAGELILIKPNIEHSFWQDEEDPADIYWVHFDFNYREDVYSLEEHVKGKQGVLFNSKLPTQNLIRKNLVFEKNLILPEHMKIENTHLIEEVFQKLLFYFKNQESFWQLECKILLLQVLRTIMQQMEGNRKRHDYKGDSEIFRNVREYIHKNYFRKLKKKEIAKAIGLHEDYIGRIFKKESGMPISEYTNRLRVAKAKELVLFSDLSMTDIAEMVGFSDLFYFSKVVKKYEGVSPSQLKDLIKNL